MGGIGMYILVFFLFLILPAVLGVAEILHFIKIAMLSSGDKGYKFNCIFLEEEDAVLKLKVFCEESNWNGIKSGREFYAVYRELSENVLNECRLIASKYDIEFLSLEDFCQIINEF